MGTPIPVFFNLGELAEDRDGRGTAEIGE